MSDKYREPRHTCPDLDKWKSHVEEMGDTVFAETRALMREVEELRSANEALREWGSAWMQRAEEAEESLGLEERKVAVLEDEIADTNREVADLARRLEVEQAEVL